VSFVTLHPETGAYVEAMRVRDAMTHGPASCEASTSLRLAAQLMTDHDCAAIPVTESGRLVGILTDRDIVTRGVAFRDDAAALPVRDCMSAPVLAVTADDAIETAVALMTENAIHHLPVIDADGGLVGILAQSDVGRRMTNREFGQLARSTSIRMKFAYRRVEALARREH
jgi:CBS domain-containing protein